MRRLLRSTRHAIRGIFYTLRNERNFQAEISVAFLVILSMSYFQLTRMEDIVLILMIMLVLTMELINTAIERVMDILKPRVHPYAKVVKDVMAGAVFLAAFGAVLAGIVILFPHFF